MNPFAIDNTCLVYSQFDNNGKTPLPDLGVRGASGGGVTGAVPCDGIGNNPALSFDGTNDKVVIPYSKTDLTKAFTSVFWIKYTFTAINKGLHSIGSNAAAWLSVKTSTAGILRTTLYTGAANVSINTSTNIGDGEWHQVAIIGDATDYWLDIDGGSEITAKFAYAALNQPVGDLFVRYGLILGSTFGACEIGDKPMLLNRAISIQEVKDLYNQFKA